jgi:TatA/E family protein of Tat protein translocase
VFLLILESLGSTELAFILVMALVFFGPRKLPQMSRSMGKHLAEFRKASEDFKRTWDREVSLEEVVTQTSVPSPTPQIDNKIWDEGAVAESAQTPSVQAIAPDEVIPRQMTLRQPEADEPALLPANETASLNSGSDISAPLDQPEPSRKRDWL